MTYEPPEDWDRTVELIEVQRERDTLHAQIAELKTKIREASDLVRGCYEAKANQAFLILNR